MATALIMSNKMSWENQNDPSLVSADDAHLLESAEENGEPSEVSLSYEDDFCILRAADPHVTEQFHMSMGNRSKSPATRKLQAVELLALSKSMPNLEHEEGETISFESPMPSPKETLFYGSKQDVFASPASIDDNSSCTSSKEDVFSSPQPVSVGKPKNLVKNVKPASILTAGSPKKQQMKASSSRRPSVKAVTSDVSPKTASSPGTIRVPVSAVKKAKTKSRPSSLKRGKQPETPKTSSKKELKEQLLRTLLTDANPPKSGGSKSVSSKSVSTTLTPTEVDSIVGNVSQHHRSRTPTTNRIKVAKSDLLQKLQHDHIKTPEGTVTTSTSTKSSKSPTKQKRVIKIRKSDLEDEKKANLDDLLDKAASEWKATLRRSSMSSGTKWTPDDPVVKEKKVEKKRPSSRSRREKRSVTDVETIIAADKSQAKLAATTRDKSVPRIDATIPNGEQTRDSSRNRSRRRSPRSYEMLRSVDDQASNDHSLDGHSRSRSSRKSLTQPSPARRKSLFGDFRMGERSSRSTRTGDATRRPSIMASVAKSSRSVSTPRATSPSLVEIDTAKARRRSLSNPRSLATDDNKRGPTSNPFSLQGLQKMLGFSPSSNKEKIQVESPVSPKGLIPSLSESPEMNSRLLARIRQAGVTDEILLALSAQGLVIVERKAITQ